MISVVIPLYNKAKTIVNTLKTVFNQTNNDFEVVIINDGSNDNGVEVIENNFNDKRIRIISQNNKGASVARNRGVEESQGDWIAFLDGDDEWHPEYLEYVSKAIKEFPTVGMVCTGGLVCNLKDKEKIFYRLANKYLGRILKVNYFENPHVFAHTSGTVVNRSIFNKTHGFPVGMTPCQDFACFQAIALISDTVYIGLPISKYVGGVEGQTTDADKEMRFIFMKNYVVYFNLIMDDFKKSNRENEKFESFIRYFIRHFFKIFIIQEDLRSLNYFCTYLSPDASSLLFKFEKVLYKSKLHLLSLGWINFTKVIWRFSRPPIVGERINLEAIPKRFRVW